MPFRNILSQIVLSLSYVFIKMKIFHNWKREKLQNLMINEEVLTSITLEMIKFYEVTKSCSDRRCLLSEKIIFKTIRGFFRAVICDSNEVEIVVYDIINQCLLGNFKWDY